MLTIIWINLAARAQKWQRETDRQTEREGRSIWGQASILRRHIRIVCRFTKPATTKQQTAIAARSVAVPVTADSRQQEQREMLIPSQFREASTQSCYDCCCDCCRCLCRLPTETGGRRSATRDPKSDRVRERGPSSGVIACDKCQ